MNNELYHWKYVKREKVGDKWKYYYDTSSMKSDFKNSIGIGGREKVAQAKAKLDEATFKRNAMIRRETKAYGGSNIGEQVKNRTTQYQSQQRHEAERDRYNRQIVTRIVEPELKTIRENIGLIGLQDKAKRHEIAADTAKLGVEAYQRRVDKEAEKLSPYRKNSAIATQEQIKAAKEYAKAQEEYFNTALGKIDKAKESISKARDFVYELFDDSPEARARRQAKKKRRK